MCYLYRGSPWWELGGGQVAEPSRAPAAAATMGCLAIGQGALARAPAVPPGRDVFAVVPVVVGGLRWPTGQGGE